MTLDDFVKDLKSLSDEELRARIDDIRRRRVQAPEKAKQAGKKIAKTAEEKALELLQALPADIRESLLKEM